MTRPTVTTLSEVGGELRRREQGCRPYSRLTPTSSATERAAMHATQDRGQPQTIGDIYAAWMATADGCDCGNLQPPDVVLPVDFATDAFRAHYTCADCGRTWTTSYALRPFGEVPT